MAVALGINLSPQLANKADVFTRLYHRPHLFSRSRVLINENGLFTRAEDIDEYLDDYMRYAKQNLVEPYDRNAITTPGTKMIFIITTCQIFPIGCRWSSRTKRYGTVLGPCSSKPPYRSLLPIISSSIRIDLL